MSYELLVSILIFSPFVGFLINGCGFRRFNYKLSGVIATSAVFVSFLSALALFFELVGLPADQRKIAVDFFSWMSVDAFNIDFGFVVDPISAIMILIITGVGSLIHLFSIGYMSHDARPAKYFAYLNLFLFNMLLLVLGENLLMMFVGWEGVGLCSYLLIGFWFTDKEKAAAGMKAFITNRIGDAAFILGMFFLFMTVGSLSFDTLNEFAMKTSPELGWSGPLTLACLFLFIGATGKSAQIPLYVWLPDAMAGPTPVSALIHAATMVTAGVYMIVRLSAVYVAAPNVMMVIAIIGALTALLAATIAVTQNDIKKILAYSTVSQLGYMFLGAGVGAFIPAMFHLMTHAFFKALMFLGSGSVIHGMHEEQDIRKMGGLKKYMPITHLTFFIGWIAIIGLPPLSGFFSKDEILWMSFHSSRGHEILWFMGLIGAAFTAFYMTRLMCLTFWGKSRVSEDVHPHESGKLMLIPLIVLAVLSFVGGWIGIPHVISGVLPGHIPNVLEGWLHSSVQGIYHPPADHAKEWALMGLSVSLVLICSYFAFKIYVLSPEMAGRLKDRMGKMYDLSLNKYWVDEFYFKRMINPLIDVSRNLWFHIDVRFIDRITYFLTDVTKGAGSVVRSIQSGNMQSYAMYISLGVVVVLAFILMR